MKSALSAMAIAITLGACAGPDVPPASGRPYEPRPPTEPGLSRLQRLSRAQYVNAIHDLFGDDVVIVASTLEPDTAQEGFFSVGASERALSVRGVEQYERAAYAIADQLTTPERRARLFTACAPVRAEDDACAAMLLEPIARRAWRRPLLAEERTMLADLFRESAVVLGDFWEALEYGIAAILVSPDYLYIPSLPRGEGDPRLDAYALAARLAYFLWSSIPDEALLSAAASGALDDEAGRRAEVARMIADPRARAGMRAFTNEWLQLYLLTDLSKDSTLFVDASPELGPAAREETLRMVDRFVFDLDGDFRDLLTTRETFVDRRLAALYNVRAPAIDGFALVELPDTSPRRGLLGQVSVLAPNAHPVSSSPTLRGRFVRDVLLCETSGAPPVGVDTAIPEPSLEARTLRERLTEHRANAFCASCHRRLDPIGLGLEQFDAVGRLRRLDEGAPIDASGDLDGVPFRDASELAEAMRAHPSLVPCFVERMSRYALGRTLEDDEHDTHYALSLRFAQAGFRVRALMTEIAMSDLFSQVRVEEVTP